MGGVGIIVVDGRSLGRLIVVVVVVAAAAVVGVVSFGGGGDEYSKGGWSGTTGTNNGTVVVLPVVVLVRMMSSFDSNRDNDTEEEEEEDMVSTTDRSSIILGERYRSTYYLVRFVVVVDAKSGMCEWRRRMRTTTATADTTAMTCVQRIEMPPMTYHPDFYNLNTTPV